MRRIITGSTASTCRHGRGPGVRLENHESPIPRLRRPVRRTQSELDEAYFRFMKSAWYTWPRGRGFLKRNRRFIVVSNIALASATVSRRCT